MKLNSNTVPLTLLFVVLGQQLSVYAYENAWYLFYNFTLSAMTYTNNVSFASNGVQVMMVDGAAGYIYSNAGTTGTCTQITNSVFTGTGARTVTYNTGVFLVDGNNTSVGEFFCSNAGDGTTWNALNFATLQSTNQLIIAVYAINGYVLLFGQTVIEPWVNSGGAGFPFVPVQGAVSQYGLAAQSSIASFNGSIAFVGQSKQGQAYVMEMQGYTPVIISTPDINQIMNSFTTVSDAVAFGYTLNGHDMYQLTFPSGNRSFLYDSSTQMWSEIQTGTSLTPVRHNAQFGVSVPNLPGYISSGITQSVQIVSDSNDSNLYILTPGLNTDAITGSGTGQILRLAQSRHVFEDGNQLAIDELYLNMELGTIPTGTANISMQVSKDNGNTFGTAYPITLSVPTQYSGPRVIWRRIGAARDFVFRFFTTDPVNWVITYGAAVTRSLGR